MALDQLSLALEKERDDEDPSSSSAELDKLTRYLLTDPTPYVRWRNQIIERFEKLYRLNTEERLGDVVPRQAIDPDFDFPPGQTETLVNEFLRQIDYTANPLLNTPEMMLEDGFDGAPYVFNLEEDRRKRIEW
jgi:hypothetical protein